MTAYEIRVRCTNCGGEDRVTIPCGVRIREFDCPTCECKALVKDSFTAATKTDG